MNKRRWLLFLSGVCTSLLIAGAAAVFFVPPIQDRILRYFIVQTLEDLSTRNARLFGDTSLKVLLCGTSAPVADPHRAKDCTAVFAGGKYYLVDAGPDSSRNLAL